MAYLGINTLSEGKLMKTMQTLIRVVLVLILMIIVAILVMKGIVL